MEQNIRLDVNHMMADMLGSEYGVTQEQLAAMKDAAVKAQHNVEANRGTAGLDESALQSGRNRSAD